MPTTAESEDRATMLARELENLCAGWKSSLTWGEITIMLVLQEKKPTALEVGWSKASRRRLGKGKQLKRYPLQTPEGKPIAHSQIPLLAEIILGDFTLEEVQR